MSMDASDANDTAPNEVPGFGDGPSDEFQDALEVNVADDDDSPVVFRSRSEPEQGTSSTSAFSTPNGVFNFDNLLARAIRDVSEDAIVLPWETDEWSCIFNPLHDPLDVLVPQFEPKLKVPKLVHDKQPHENVSLAESSCQDKPLFQIAVSRRKDKVWTEKRESELQRALMKWDTIIRNWPDKWTCKRELVACNTVDDAMMLLGDYLTGKAPSTLVKRANSLIFLQSTLLQLGYFWPLGEPDMYRIIKTLKMSGNSTSRLKSVLEAITFCRYAFNIMDLHDITVSRRCLGAVGGDVTGKVNQAAPLTVSDVWHLHMCLCNGGTWDRVFCGAALFCIYARARWSDFTHGSCIRLDLVETTGKVAYADMEVQIHKTMRAAANRFKFLDLVASGTGIFGDDWVHHWIEALQSVGVDPHSDEPGKTLMPAPAEDGTAQKRALESDEASVWLRLILGEDMERKNSSRQISSHSLKATLLAMAAKRGLKHEDRLAMGHHVHPFKMADTYARDAQARTIRLLDKLLLEIRSGYFDPDSTRAGRFNKNLLPDPSLDIGAQSLLESDAESMEMEKKVDDALDDAVKVVEDATVEMDETHFTSSSSESDAESVEYQAPVRMFRPPSAPDGYHFMQHRRTKTLHLVDYKYPAGTCCGRVLDQNFVAPTQLRYDSPTCHVCRRHRMD